MILYEFLFGRLPFNLTYSFKPFTEINHTKLHIPNGSSNDSKTDLISMLLSKNPENRLVNLKSHRWFENFDFD